MYRINAVLENTAVFADSYKKVPLYLRLRHVRNMVSAPHGVRFPVAFRVRDIVSEIFWRAVRRRDTIPKREANELLDTIAHRKGVSNHWTVTRGLAVSSDVVGWYLPTEMEPWGYPMDFEDATGRSVSRPEPKPEPEEHKHPPRYPFLKGKEEEFWKGSFVLEKRIQKQAKGSPSWEINHYDMLDLWKGYCREVIWRAFRAKKRVTKKELLCAEEKLKAKYLHPLTKYELSYCGMSWSVGEGELVVYWEREKHDSIIYALTKGYIPVGEKFADMESSHWSDDYDLEDYVEQEMSPVEAELIVVHGEHSPAPWVPISDEYAFNCCLCGRRMSKRSYFPKGMPPRSKKELGRMDSAYRANISYIPQGRGTCIRACRGPCTELVYSSLAVRGKPFTAKQVGDLLLTITGEVIKHANSDSHIRGAAENFIRYARPVFEGGSYGAGRESGSQVV